MYQPDLVGVAVATVLFCGSLFGWYTIAVSVEVLDHLSKVQSRWRRMKKND